MIILSTQNIENKKLQMKKNKAITRRIIEKELDQERREIF